MFLPLLSFWVRDLTSCQQKDIDGSTVFTAHLATSRAWFVHKSYRRVVEGQIPKKRRHVACPAASTRAGSAPGLTATQGTFSYVVAQLLAFEVDDIASRICAITSLLERRTQCYHVENTAAVSHQVS